MFHQSDVQLPVPLAREGGDRAIIAAATAAAQARDGTAMEGAQENCADSSGAIPTLDLSGLLSGRGADGVQVMK